MKKLKEAQSLHLAGKFRTELRPTMISILTLPPLLFRLSRLIFYIHSKFLLRFFHHHFSYASTQHSKRDSAIEAFFDPILDLRKSFLCTKVIFITNFISLHVLLYSRFTTAIESDFLASKVVGALLPCSSLTLTSVREGLLVPIARKYKRRL